MRLGRSNIRSNCHKQQNINDTDCILHNIEDVIGFSQNDVELPINSRTFFQGTSGTARTATASRRTLHEMEASQMFRSEVTSAKVLSRNTGSKFDLFITPKPFFLFISVMEKDMIISETVVFAHC